ncbi:MAG: folylpolyglutamate synthase/dihydrofolate synthase family protein [Candidatus Brocadiales bacterium]
MRFGSYEEAIEFLFQAIDYEKRTDYKYDTPGFNLDRVERLLSQAGSPHRRLRAVHVAGTKGKGSTAAMIARLLNEADLKPVGLFTSPHLVHLEERIKVNDTLITRDDVRMLLGELRPYIEKERRKDPLLAPTYFETVTALALMHFRDTGVGWAVLEAGMGGRLDATNVIRPRVSVITGISFDHMDMLGETLKQIAGEKAGIIKEGVPVISSPQPPEALGSIEKICDEKGVQLYLVGRDMEILGLKGLALDGIMCDIKTWQRTYHNLRLPLRGEHQAENLAAAIGAVEVLAGSGGLSWDETVAAKALEGLQCAARIEVVSRRPLVVLDSAHNVSSARALTDTLRKSMSFDRLVLVLGLSMDKDLEGIFAEVAPMAHRVVLTAPDFPRSAPPGLLAERIMPHLRPGGEALVADDPCDALRLAKKLARPEDCICITGSFYLAGRMKELLEGE